MWKIIGFIVALSIHVDGFNDISKINRLKKSANTALERGDYETAIHHFHVLRDSLGVEDDRITLNLAHAYYKNEQSTLAMSNYQAASLSANPTIKSQALNQLGVLSEKSKQMKDALSYFKSALKSNPKNEEARHNYETLKRFLDQNPDQNQNQDQDDKKEDSDDKQDQDKEDKDSSSNQNDDSNQGDQQDEDQEQQEDSSGDQNQEDQDGEDAQDQKDDKKNQQEKDKNKEDQKAEGDKDKEDKKDEGQPSEPDSNEQKEEEGDKNSMPQPDEQEIEGIIPKERALMLLEAMKNNEKQYIQQNKRRSTRKTDPNKPDW